MGHRIHYARKYDVDYSGGYFNHRVEEFEDMAINELDFYWSNDEGTEWEIPVDSVKTYIKKLKKLSADAPNEYFIDDEPYTNGEVIEVLDDILGGYDKNHNFIRLAWY